MLNPQLQAKFLLHLNNRKKNNEEGFTLIELLVVIIIIGILAAIALPSLLGQVNKAKQAEAKNYTGVVNRSQQAYYLEYTNFATTLPQLQVGIKSQTTNYTYKVDSNSKAAGPTQFDSIARNLSLKDYYGLVYTQVSTDATKEALTLAIACEGINPVASANLAMANETNTTSGCGTGYVSLSR